ncbi:516_t:CDS:1, partial [Funneliformis mosseae]
MPFINEYGDKYYWKEQLDFEYDQYTVFSHNRSNLQSWLDDKKNTFDSIMKYAKDKQELKELKERENTLSFFFDYHHDYFLPSLPSYYWPLPLLPRIYNDDELLQPRRRRRVNS